MGDSHYQLTEDKYGLKFRAQPLCSPASVFRFSSSTCFPSSFFLSLRYSSLELTVNMEATIDGISTEFITGSDPQLVCDRRIGGGGYGRVYAVRISLLRKLNVPR